MVSRSHLCRLCRLVALALLIAGGAHAQALHVEELPGGGRLVVVADANATATSVAWAEPGGVRSVTGGAMSLPLVLGRALGEAPRPAELVAVGAAEPAVLRAVLAALPPPQAPVPSPPAPAAPPEGLLERRLAASGAASRLELTVPLPPPGDPLRPAVQVLLTAAPAVLAPAHRGLAVRLEDATAVLDLPVEPELAELELRRLRLALAQLAGAPRLDRDAVAAARRLLVVRRQAHLERHPEGAEAVLAALRAGGPDAVRGLLWGLEAVGPEDVAAAARAWLPLHPGRAVVQLPPQVFDPRFAPPPERLGLSNDLTALVLEHAGSPFAAVALQPALQGDLEGAHAAAVLARLAVQVRADEAAPPLVQLDGSPARLLLAAAPEELGEALEALQRALAAARETPPAPPGGAGGRALSLLAGALGLPGSDGGGGILRPPNLALGVVAPDAETAVDTIVKFMSVLERPEGPTATAPPIAAPLRETTEGTRSALALALPVEGLSPARRRLLAALLERRLALTLPGVGARVLEPLVPGRPVVVVVLEAEATLPQLEQRVAAAWPMVVAPVPEEELADLRPRVASELAAAGSGALGAARRLAAAAAGAGAWRPMRDVELEVLSATPEDVGRPLADAGYGQLVVTAAGPVPATGLPRTP